MKVKAAPGLQVPTEHNARRYIKDDTEVDVERRAYYLRAVADGDLIEVVEAVAADSADAGPVAKKTR